MGGRLLLGEEMAFRHNQSPFLPHTLKHFLHPTNICLTLPPPPPPPPPPPRPPVIQGGMLETKEKVNHMFLSFVLVLTSNGFGMFDSFLGVIGT